MKKIFLAIAMLLSVAGFAQIQSATLTASGLTCSMCSKAIYKALLKVPAIDKVEVDIEKSSYIITFDKNATVSPETLKKAVEGAGFAIAKLEFIAAVPKTTVNADTKLSLQGTSYRFIRPNGQTIQGMQTLKVIDKSYLSPNEWKRYAKDVSAKRETGVYFVTL